MLPAAHPDYPRYLRHCIIDRADQGESAPDIAACLAVSVATVETVMADCWAVRARREARERERHRRQAEQARRQAQEAARSNPYLRGIANKP